MSMPQAEKPTKSKRAVWMRQAERLKPPPKGDFVLSFAIKEKGAPESGTPLCVMQAKTLT